MTHAAPPLVNAELICARDWAGSTPPWRSLQDGIRTIRSRGKLIPIACPPPGDRCSRIIVSERGSSFFSERPYLPLAPARVSDPSSRMFIALFSFFGRSGPSCAFTSSCEMFPNAWRYRP